MAQRTDEMSICSSGGAVTVVDAIQRDCVINLPAVEVEIEIRNKLGLMRHKTNVRLGE